MRKNGEDTAENGAETAEKEWSWQVDLPYRQPCQGSGRQAWCIVPSIATRALESPGSRGGTYRQGVVDAEEARLGKLTPLLIRQPVRHVPAPGTLRLRIEQPQVAAWNVKAFPFWACGPEESVLGWLTPLGRAGSHQAPAPHRSLPRAAARRAGGRQSAAGSAPCTDVANDASEEESTSCSVAWLQHGPIKSFVVGQDKASGLEMSLWGLLALAAPGLWRTGGGGRLRVPVHDIAGILRRMQPRCQQISWQLTTSPSLFAVTRLPSPPPRSISPRPRLSSSMPVDNDTPLAAWKKTLGLEYSPDGSGIVAACRCHASTAGAACRGRSRRSAPGATMSIRGTMYM